jgi:hypothetical protein
MQSKGKARYSSEVAATPTAQRPEQLGFIVFTDSRQVFALGRDNVCFHQVIYCQAATARERPQATALSQSPDADLRTSTTCRCITARACRKVNLPPECTTADRNLLVASIETYRLQGTQIDDHLAIPHCVSQRTVAATTASRSDSICGAKLDASDHVVRTQTRDNG